MKKTLLSQLSIYQQSVLLAILIHIIAGKLFVFSVSSKQIPNRPSFIFRGAILDPIGHETLEHNTASDAAASELLIPRNKPFGEKNFNPSKPLASLSSRVRKQKMFPKTTFLEKQKPRLTADTYAQTKFKYIPLKFSPILP